MKAVLISVTVLALTGCVAEQPANQQQVQKLGEQCMTYGFKPGTDQFNACIFQLDQNRIAENRRRRIAIGNALSETGDQMQANARNQQMINAVNRPVTCNSTPGYGGTVRTNCY